ncbi:hypothetical protein [Sphingomonas sp. TX0522]|uniref:hypothetical protein n=1 Tax=Sphingomonas sp. TX0522 TaxID=2479205 RepID=UPI0018DF6115|nr:hypothetical protein [Sphingomonas sp. TX0522]
MKVIVEQIGETVRLILECDSEADATHRYEHISRQLNSGEITLFLVAKAPEAER